MKIILVTLLTLAAAPAAQKAQTFTGTITDDACGKGGHASMRMGPTDADCTNACVSAHGTAYALVDGKTLYVLKSRNSLEKFAAQKVSVVGTLDSKTNTIQVDSIAVSK